MINYYTVAGYFLLPFIVTNPYIPILQGHIIYQSALVASLICLYSLAYMIYTNDKVKGLYDYISAAILPFFVVFPVALLYITVLYILYYSLGVKIIISLWLSMWVSIVYLLGLEKMPLSDSLHYQIAGESLLVSVYSYFIVYTLYW